MRQADVWEADGWRCRAEPAADGRYALSGDKDFVADAQAADVLLVLAQSPDGPGLFAADTADERVQVTPLQSLDATRRLSRVTFDAAPGRLLGKPGAGSDILARALPSVCCALAAEQAGVARRALEMAVEYGQVREQFGRLIGSFQAVKQKCADVLIAIETAVSAVTAAAAACDADSDEADVLAHLALAQAGEAVVFACTENIEVHGGIGFTWEHSAHLYYKRAIASSVLLGSPARHHARMLTALGR
jgi:alkylation response protein AidB-like acyl-CoA dehydrogenase